MLLEGVAGSTDFAMLNNALTDSNVPAKGSDPTAVDATLAGTAVEGCWLYSIKARVVSKGIVRVFLKYQHTPIRDVTVTASNSLSQVQTNKDIDGNPITLEYTYPSDYGGDAPSQREFELRGKNREQGGTVSVLKPENVREYHIREASDPGYMQWRYGGKTNLTTMFTAGGGTGIGDNSGKWLLASISGTSDFNNSGVEMWNNVYTFQYKEDGWDPEAVFVREPNRDPAPDAVQGTGIKTISSYERVDFLTELYRLGLYP